MNDTDGYIAAAQYPSFSWQSLTAERPPTVPLLYRVFMPQSGYKLTNVSQASLGGETKQLAPQPGFEGIVIFQMVFSILTWCVLAWVVFFKLKTPGIRLTAVALILIFAFSPQVADWDSILSSESLTFSLLALVLAFTILLVHRMANKIFTGSFSSGILLAAWLASITLWIFARDSNVYLIPVTVVFLILAGFLALKKKGALIMLGVAALYLLGLFTLQQKTMNLSMRWEKPFIADLIGNVLSYPSRVDFFIQKGMPFSPKLKDAIKAGVRHDDYAKFPDFMQWMKNGGYSTYTQFLISNPFWASLQVYNDLDGLFGSNLQPYFPTGTTSRPGWLVNIGNLVHPLSTTVIPEIFLLSAIIFAAALMYREPGQMAWAAFFIWLLLVAFLLLFVGYHGDFYSKDRHVLVPVLQMRLSFWMTILIAAEFIFSTKEKQRNYR